MELSACVSNAAGEAGRGADVDPVRAVRHGGDALEIGPEASVDHSGVGALERDPGLAVAVREVVRVPRRVKVFCVILSWPSASPQPLTCVRAILHRNCFGAITGSLCRLNPTTEKMKSMNVARAVQISGDVPHMY